MFRKVIGAAAVAAVAAVAAMIGCTAEDADPRFTDLTGEEPGAVSVGNEQPSAPTARATLHDANGEEVGSVVLEETSGGLAIEYRLTDFGNGEHAIHVHEVGSCTPPDFESAGDHFNPDGRAHGLDHPDGPHAGDLPNVAPDASGVASGTFHNSHLTLRAGAEHSLLGGDGTALVLHAEADDHESQPAGDYGDRIACGVIEAD